MFMIPSTYSYLILMNILKKRNICWMTGKEVNVGRDINISLKYENQWKLEKYSRPKLMENFPLYHYMYTLDRGKEMICRKHLIVCCQNWPHMVMMRSVVSLWLHEAGLLLKDWNSAGLMLDYISELSVVHYGQGPLWAPFCHLNNETGSCQTEFNNALIFTVTNQHMLVKITFT